MKDMSRRTFLKASAAAAAGAAVLAKAPVLGVQAEEEMPAADIADVEVSMEYTTDVVVVGGGMSGLSAAVQASELGAGVMLLEANDFMGGNGNGTEGVFAAKSKYQTDMDPIEFSDIVTIENSSVNYRLNTLFWKDLYFNSADNIQWLQKGHCQNVRRGSGNEKDLLIADLLITDPHTIQQVLDGKREISCGYNESAQGTVLCVDRE